MATGTPVASATGLLHNLLTKSLTICRCRAAKCCLACPACLRSQEQDSWQLTHLSPDNVIFVLLYVFMGGQVPWLHYDKGNGTYAAL